MAKQAKMDQDFDELCCGETACVRDLVDYVYSLQFEEKPDYDLVRQMLNTMITSKETRSKLA